MSSFFQWLVRRNIRLWEAVLAVVMLAGGGYWMGSHTRAGDLDRIDATVRESMEEVVAARIEEDENIWAAVRALRVTVDSLREDVRVRVDSTGGAP